MWIHMERKMLILYASFYKYNEYLDLEIIHNVKTSPDLYVRPGMLDSLL